MEKKASKKKIAPQDVKLLKSATFNDGVAKEVDVEVSFIKALPNFVVVGLANEAIKESKERVKSALSFADFSFPPLKVTINLSPSDLKKEGSHFDLSIALSILINKETEYYKNFFIFGELGLDGKIKDTVLIFPIVLSLAKKVKNLEVLTSIQSAKKLAKIPNIKIFAVSNIKEAKECLTQDKNKYLFKTDSKIDFKYIEIDNKKYYYDSTFVDDFSEVKGQEIAKRAAVISASGMHNILFNGSPGSGKSMIIKRLRYIMPPMSIEEILDKAMLEALSFKEPTFTPIRAYRQPHHSATKASIFGGGSKTSKIGEVALSNNGILFFDELPHFSKNILEALREPLEDNRLLISRVNSKIEYSAKFLFATAMNPCPCGNLLSEKKECRCNELDIKRYKNRLSEPFLDRIDIFVTLRDSDLSQKPSFSSKDFQELVLKAFYMQKKRAQNNLNGKLTEKEIKKFCTLGLEEEEILKSMANRLSLSFRSINKILKVARTIADLNQSNKITKEHLLEAFSFRYR